MRGVVTQNGQMAWTEIAEPALGEGQVRVKTLTCGICGTDLHARGHVHDFLEGLKRSGTPLATDGDKAIVFGHEFYGEIVEHGPGASNRFKPGTRVVGLPFLTSPRGAEYVGYSDAYPGGFAEQMVLTEKLLFEVPNGLSSIAAALTEPFAVGAHAVARARIPEKAVCLIVGCGPIGLSVIAALKARGIGPVIAMDFSAGRRRFAEAMGADEVIDAACETQTEVWARWRGAAKGARPVAFECVGRPGVADQVVRESPRHALVVVVGNALEACTIDQVVAFNKELDICFTMNYAPGEFRQALEDLAEGRIRTDDIVTAVVAPQDTPQAFDDLKDPEQHAKIVVQFD